jgi:thioredoxin reductase
VIYAKGDEAGAGLALEMTQWTRNLILCTDGPGEISESCRTRLDRFGISVCEERIDRMEEDGDNLVQIYFNGGEILRPRAVFFNTTRHQSTDLAQRLGCKEFGPKGCELKGDYGRTSIHGLYVIGDASRDVLQVVVAAGEGAQAAIAVNSELLKDDGVL